MNKRYIVRYKDEYSYNYLKKKNTYCPDYLESFFSYRIGKSTVMYKTLKRAFDRITKFKVDDLHQFEVVEFIVGKTLFESKITDKVYTYRNLLLYYKLKNLKTK